MATGAGRLYKGFLLFLLLGIFLELAALVSVLRGESDPDGNIAVVEVVGEIVDPRGVVEKLKKFEKNEKVKAVVLRVNSPGGAVGASQEIHDEVVRLKAKKKIVVSMGDVAASGGYYVSAPADRSIANPGTLTGSIGVIASYFVFDDLLKKFNLKWEVITAGNMKDIGSPLRSLKPEERVFLKSLLEDTHRQFVEAIAEGRKLPVDKVTQLADGRIYTGRMAKELGLVDDLGSLEYAIQEAGKLAGVAIDKVQAIYPEKEKFGFFQKLSEKTNLRQGLQVLYEMKP